MIHVFKDKDNPLYIENIYFLDDTNFHYLCGSRLDDSNWDNTCTISVKEIISNEGDNYLELMTRVNSTKEFKEKYPEYFI